MGHAGGGRRLNGWDRRVAERLERLDPTVAAAWRAEIGRHLSPWREVGGADFDVPPRWKDVQRYQLLDGRLFRLPAAADVREPWFERHRNWFEVMLGTLLVRAAQDGVAPPDQDFALNLGDYPPPGSPVWSTWCREGDGNVPVPGLVHYGWPDRPFDPTEVRVLDIFAEEARSVPWEDRRPLAGWRGSATGMFDGKLRWARLRRWLLGGAFGEGLTRLDLCRIGAEHPDLLDVAISGFAQLSPASERAVRAAVRCAEWVQPDWFLQFRYLLNVDGNVATSSFPAFLGSGSTVLRQESPWREFWTPFCEPGREFVPIARDLTDLVPVLRDLIGNGAGREVQEAGDRFVRRWLSAEAVDAWWILLLGEWGRLTPEPIPHPDRVEVDRPE